MDPCGLAAGELQYRAGDPVVYFGFLIGVADFPSIGKRSMIIGERDGVVTALLFGVGYSAERAGLLIEIGDLFGYGLSPFMVDESFAVLLEEAIGCADVVEVHCSGGPGSPGRC